MDAAAEIYLTVGVCLWGAAVGIQYMLGYEFVEGQLINVCTVVGRNSEFNHMCVGFPLALVLMAEVLRMNDVGALGLTPMLETLCLLGVTGCQGISRMHIPLCATAGVAFCCMCLIASPPEYGMAAALPMILLGLMLGVWKICHRTQRDEEGNARDDTVSSVLCLLLYSWSVFGRLFLLCDHPEPADFRSVFDLAVAISLSILLLGAWAITKAGL